MCAFFRKHSMETLYQHVRALFPCVVFLVVVIYLSRTFCDSIDKYGVAANLSYIRNSFCIDFFMCSVATIPRISFRACMLIHALCQPYRRSGHMESAVRSLSAPKSNDILIRSGKIVNLNGNFNISLQLGLRFFPSSMP